MPTTTSSIRPNTVLIVDDDEGARLVIAKMLKDYVAAVITARSGAEAMAVLAADHGSIDTVLTDVTMPDMTGLELAYHVRERYPHIGIVILSGDISEIERSVVARAGVPFLKKPVRIEPLLGAIREARRDHENGQEASARV